jgi:carbamoyltransferase
MKILGVNGFCFDASVALVADGVPVFYAEEERFNREKKTREFPVQAMARLFEATGVDPGEIDAVVCPWDPWKGFWNSVRIVVRHFPESLAMLLPQVSTDCNMVYGTNILGIGRALRRAFPAARRVPVRYLDHHRCHAALAFHTSPFRAADVLVMDGFGDDCSTSLFEASGGRLRRVAHNRMFQSLGLLYSLVTRHLGFAPYREEGTVMGLAAHGDGRFVEAFGRLVRLEPESRYAMDAEWLSFHKFGELRPFTRRFLSTFGPPRQPGETIDDRHRALARALQETTERVLLHVTRGMATRSRTGRLCFGGGVALNCLANGRIALESGYREVFVPAAPGDGGTSLGAALHHARALGELAAVPGARAGGSSGGGGGGVSAFLGCEYADSRIVRALDQAGLPARRVDDVAAEAARLIAAGAVVGWYQGRSEMGPRALGSRSVLADPRSRTVAGRLNSVIKQREPFRPYAPSVLASRVGSIFEGTAASPFMSFALRVRPDRRDDVPAVLQVDGTARLQTVTRAQHPRYHRLIERFEELTGVPLVLNTSFNRRAPIVETPDHAVEFYRTMQLDALAIGDHLVVREASSR